MTTEILRYNERNTLHIIVDGVETARLEPDTDVSEMSAEIQAVAEEFWTDEIKQAYQDHLAEEATEATEKQAKWDAEAQARTNATARAYLKETDWYVSRFVETAQAIPTEIATLRAAARLAVIEV